MLSCSRDFVHQSSKCGLLFATCKRNYAFLKKTFSLVYIYTYPVNTHCIISAGWTVSSLRKFSLKIKIAYIFRNHSSVAMFKNCIDMCQRNSHTDFQLTF